MPKELSMFVTAGFARSFQKLDKKLQHLTMGYLEQASRNRGKVTSQTPIEKIYALIDESIELLWNTDVGRKVPCKSGCSHCCYIRVVCSEAEFAAAEKEAISNGYFIDVEVAREQLQHINKVENIGSLRTEENSNDEYLELPTTKRKCVFLNSENKCAAYQSRPVSCRKYMVISDPKACDTSNGSHDTQVLELHETEFVMSIFAMNRKLEPLQHWVVNRKKED